MNGYMGLKEMPIYSVSEAGGLNNVHKPQVEGGKGRGKSEASQM